MPTHTKTITERVELTSEETAEILRPSAVEKLGAPSKGRVEVKFDAWEGAWEGGVEQVILTWSTESEVGG